MPPNFGSNIQANLLILCAIPVRRQNGFMEKNMKLAKIFAPGLFVISLGAFAQTKAEVAEMLNSFSKSGFVNQEQIQQAKAQLEKMSENQFKTLVEAGKSMRNDPAIREKLREFHPEVSP